MSALELAQFAFIYARNCVPMKSDNKGYGMLKAPPPGKAASPELKMNRHFAMYALKGMAPDPRRTTSSGTKLRSSTTNCRTRAIDRHELAGAAVEECAEGRVSTCGTAAAGGVTRSHYTRGG
jgi:hypothetical protein